jgi:hypothetical protein
MTKLEDGNKDEIESLEYKLAREYNWTVNKDEASKGYVTTELNDRFCYNIVRVPIICRVCNMNLMIDY